MPITYDDKDNTLPTSDPRRLVRDDDLNEIKSVVNANETTMTSGLSARPLTSSFVWSEIPTGTINGSNDTFTLANDPIAGTARVYADGIRVNASGFSIVGTALTLTIPPDNSLQIDYMK